MSGASTTLLMSGSGAISVALPPPPSNIGWIGGGPIVVRGLESAHGGVSTGTPEAAAGCAVRLYLTEKSAAPTGVTGEPDASTGSLNAASSTSALAEPLLTTSWTSFLRASMCA